MNNNKPSPIVLIIIIIVLAAFVLIKFSRDNEAIDGLNTAPSPTESSQSKLPPGSTPPGNPELLKEREWIWERTVMNDDSVITPVKADSFTLKFNPDNTVSGKTDCNSFSGSYQVGTDGHITFGPMAMTKMFCDGSQEMDFVGPMSRVGNYSISEEDGKLLLYFNEGLIILSGHIAVSPDLI